MSLRIAFDLSAAARVQKTPVSPTKPAGPPYAPQHQSLGEVPSTIPDVPINAVFLLLFIIGAVAHMTILQINLKKKQKKFVLSGAIFGFCMTRIIATVLRIAWARHPDSVNLGITAAIFVYAGIIILFIANLFFAQRIVRAQHPHVGWSKPFAVWLPLVIVLLVATILCLIAAVVVMFYTYEPGPQQAVRNIQSYGSLVFTLAAFLPIPIVAISALARRHPTIKATQPVDKFGSGSMRAKVAISLVSAVLLTLGAAYRAGTTLLPPTAIDAPEPSYFSKASFYIFDFTIEIIVVYLWWFTRIDSRFYVPDKAHGPGSYAGGFVFAGEAGNEKSGLPPPPPPGSGSSMYGSQRNLLTTAPSTRRTSYSSARYQDAAARISWGGISRDRVAGERGEDGLELPHPMYDPELESLHSQTAADVGVDGAEKEMGWDPKTGKWALRPISVLEGARLASGAGAGHGRYARVSQGEGAGPGVAGGVAK